MSETYCEHCAEPIGAGHKQLETDCVLEHPDHAERKHGLLCPRHWHWMGNTLAQITELFALRGCVVLPSLGSFGGDRPSGAIDSPAPGRIDVMAMTDKRIPAGPIPMTYERNWNGRALESNGEDMLDVPGTLTSWARLVIEERDLDYPLDGTVTVAVRLLRRERHWITQQTWVDEYVAELLAVHVALARGIGDSMWPRPIGRCPNCPAKTSLYVTIGVDQVTCRKCKTTWEGLALARLRLIHEQEGAPA